MKKVILAGIILGIVGVGQLTAFAAVKDYGSNVNRSNGYKNAQAWTSGGDGTVAKVSMGGLLDEVTRKGYAQTKTVTKFGTYTAHIGHGDGNKITIAYQK